jgi:hypothetical protein
MNKKDKQKLKNLYFNFEKSNDYFESVLVPFIKELITKGRNKHGGQK